MISNRATYDSTSEERSLGEFILETVRYVPLLTSLLTVGLLATYFLAGAGLLGKPSWQLLAVAGISFCIAWAHLVVSSLARRGRGDHAYLLFALILAVWSVSIIALWEDAWPIGVLIAWIAPLAGLAARARRRPLILASALGLACTAAGLWLNAHPLLTRLSPNDQSGLASLVLLGSTVVLFVLGAIVVRLFTYRSVQGRLVTSFVLIMSVPVLLITGISALGAFTNSQDQFSNSLQAVSALKQDQMETPLQAIALQMNGLQQGVGKANSILHVLYPASLSATTIQSDASSAAALLNELIVQYPSSHYEEVLVLDIRGTVVLTTYSQDKGSNWSDEAFFREFFHEGSAKFHAEMLRFPGKQNATQEYKLVSAAPLYGASSQDIRGVIVTVANSDIIFKALGPISGLPNAATYLVNGDYRMVTNGAGGYLSAQALPVVSTVQSKQAGQSSAYVNDQGQSVLGYAAWNPDLNMAVITEIPRADVFNRALSSLLVSSLLGIFAIVIAGITALATSRVISEPIRDLAATAKSLATGDLTTHAATGQTDEVGQLASSFNSMAEQLQSMIGNLEQRIAERTDALEQQTLRLRTAAEVARDAASAPNRETLLEQAASLIRDRFGFYHTGIFLLDEKKEYAVLMASPSEAGKKMLERQHRLRVGEQGLVGRVAGTGEPRIALDTGVDPVYFSNPLLPNTHSEMALPLKTPDGTIGVIDIQSDQPEAFTQDDIAIVQVMADQLATAIQRTQLLQQVQTQLSQMEQTYQTFTEQTWQKFGQAGLQNIGYRFDNVRLEPIKADQESSRLGSALPDNMSEQIVQVPIRLRGQIIGMVNLRFQSARASAATAVMIQQIADRLATALENARLLEDSVRRANKERAIAEITTKISASVNMRNVLQTAVEELGRAIPGSDVLIQFRPEAGI